MSENYLNFNYFDSFMAIFMTSFILFLVPFILITTFLVMLNDDDYKKIKNKMNNGKWESFSSFYIFIETSPVAEIQYSKKDNFKGGLICNLYRYEGTLYIVKDPKSDNYFVSDERDIVMKAAKGEIRNNLDRITFSREAIKKAIENKVENLPVVKESELQ